MTSLDQDVEWALMGAEPAGHGLGNASVQREAAAWGGVLGGCVAVILCGTYLMVSSLLGTPEGLGLNIVLTCLVLSTVLGVSIGAQLARNALQQPAGAAQWGAAPALTDSKGPPARDTADWPGASRTLGVPDRNAARGTQYRR